MPENIFLYMKLMPWLHFTVYCLVPFLSLLIFNGLIIVSLTITQRQFLTNQMTKDDRRMRHIHRKLAITLLSLSFVWMLTTTPSALNTVTVETSIHQLSGSNDARQDHMLYTAVYQSFYTVLYNWADI